VVWVAVRGGNGRSKFIIQYLIIWMTFLLSVSYLQWHLTASLNPPHEFQGIRKRRAIPNEINNV